MFTLKVFHTDGSYTAISCKNFRVTPGVGSEKTSISYTQEDGEGGTFKVDPRVIVENANGKTIDVIRPYNKGDKHAD